MNEKIKKGRRFFLKTLISLGVVSMFSFKWKPFNILEECEITSNDIEGPFYIENSPNISILTK